jgi:branched-chain amino acid transport system substrate-binding protein
MRKRAMMVGVLVLAQALLVAALGFGQAKPVVSEWQIPFLNCLTGPLASHGSMYQWSANQAAADINKAGGIAGKPVKVIGVDTANDPQKGTVEMARLVKDSLVALGPVPEPVIMAAMPIAVENQMMSITGSTSYEYASKFFPWSVSWFPPYPVRLPPLVKAWAKEFTDLKQVVQFVENYGPWPLMADSHVAGLKAANVNVLKNVEVPGDAVTFGPLVVKALDQKPDGIIFACNAEKIAKLIKELKSRGWTKMDHLLVFSSGDDAPLYTTGGADINGVQVYNYINPDVDNPRWNAFKAAFMKDHNGMAPFSLSTNYYDAVYMLKEAIEKTGVTGDPKKLKEERKKIADYCANVKNFKGVMFTWDMKDGVPANKPLFIFEIQGGKKKLVQEVKPQL